MNVVHPDRGTKRICQSCGTKFYDLGRTPIVCPKCDAIFVEAPRPAPVARTKGRGTPWSSRPLEAPAYDPADRAPANETEADEDGESDDELDEEEVDAEELPDDEGE